MQPILIPIGQTRTVGTYNLGLAETFIPADCTGGAVNLNLPAANSVANGKTYVVKKIDGSANHVFINVNGLDLIVVNGTTLSQDDTNGLGRVICFISDGASKWYTFTSVAPG